MSMETWKAEFYPIPASEVSVEAAPAHALLKWIGYRDENLAKHGLIRISEYSISECDDGTGPSFIAGHEECALCTHYLVEDPDDPNYPCDACPLYKLSKRACGYEGSAYSDLDDAYKDGPTQYNIALENMIDLLKRVVDHSRCP